MAAALTWADEQRGTAFIHPFDDLAIVAGQATLGLELVEDVPDLRRVVVRAGWPVGWRSPSSRPIP